MPKTLSKSLAVKLAQVKVFLCDVDGVLTDCTVLMSGRGETKPFDIRDGLGLRLLQRCGIKVGWISGRTSPATTQRARDLQVDFLCQGNESKVAVVERLLVRQGWTWKNACFMGDDLLDLGAMKRAGAAFSVPEAIAEARALADYVTQASGGHGAVREAAALILEAQDKWAPLVKEYLE
jgi:3-deoxy-D-manno-octulosonate 8-phosphate phosphatase (KDO 8-P phosphatase)